MKKEYTGIILAGGCNSRISLTKALICIDSLSIIERTIQLFKKKFDEIIIVANEKEKFSHLNLPVIPDEYKALGPLAGIHAGLKASSKQYSFFAACDMPFINEGIIDHLINNNNEHDVVIPEYGNFIEPLCGIYSKNCLPLVEQKLRNKELKIRNFFADVKVNRVIWEDEQMIDGKPLVFYNINTHDDLEKAVAYYEQKKQ